MIHATGAIYNPASLAEYALVSWQDGALNVVQRRVAVDADAVRMDAAAKQVTRSLAWSVERDSGVKTCRTYGHVLSGMPHPECWRGDWSI